jgi:hypothetical protein
MRRFSLIIVTLAWIGAPAVASDYATKVVEYVKGGEVPMDFITMDEYDDPTTALGPPTIDTTGDDYYTGSSEHAVPVLPVYQPFRYFEVVSIGQGGRLVLKFDQPVFDHPLNPCGIDFIIFGNTNQTINGIDRWRNGDPQLTSVRGMVAGREPGKVSVSQDGIVWHEFSNGPFADDFAPTLGRRYDPANPDLTLPGNLWWGEPTDPTYPLDPSLTAASFANWTVAQIAIKYGCSAGGTGFDLADVDLRWIQYVRIENPPFSGMTPEIDAVARVVPRLLPDFDCDSDVDDDDLAFLIACSTGPGLGPPAPGCERADLNQDGHVDQVDFAIWQRCRTGPDVIFNAECMN